MAAVTKERLDELRTTFSTAFFAAYEKSPVVYPELTLEIPSEAASNVYGWLAQQVNLREWIGAREETDLGEHVKELFNKSFERTISIDRDKIEDNKLWDYTAMVFPQLGEAARKHPDSLLYAMIAANPITWDGKALFADDHPNFNVTGSGDTTYDNDFALALDATNLTTVRENMALITGEDGQPAGVTPNILLHGPKLIKTALELTQAENIAQIAYNSTTVAAASAPTNVVRQYGLRAVEWNRITDNSWYLLDTTRPIKPFVFQKRRPLNFVAMTAPTDEAVFMQKKFRWGVDARYAVGETLPWLIARSYVA